MSVALEYKLKFGASLMLEMLRRFVWEKVVSEQAFSPYSSS